MKKIFDRFFINCIICVGVLIFLLGLSFSNESARINFYNYTVFAQETNTEENSEVLPPQDPFDDDFSGLEDGLIPGLGESAGGPLQRGDTFFLLFIILGMVSVAIIISFVATKKQNGRRHHRRYAFDVHYKAKQNLEERLKKEAETQADEQEKMDAEKNNDSAKTER